MTNDVGTIERRRLSEVFVVWFGGCVLLMVDGLPTEENIELVDEVRDSLVRTGVPRDDIDVLWGRTPDRSQLS